MNNDSNKLIKPIEMHNPLQARFGSDAMKLIGISFLALFFELALIRYTNSTVQVIKYFNNFMILSAVLGLGFGSLWVRPGRNIFKYFPMIAFGVVGLMTYFDTYGFRPTDTSQVIWASRHLDAERNLPVPFVVSLVFGANFLFFVPIGYKLGDLLDQFENRLEGYAYDLLGSLLGVLAFALVSYLRIPPSGWFFLGGLVAILLLDDKKIKIFTGSILLFTATLCLTMLPEEGEWSPYYKITKRSYGQEIEGKLESLGFAIMVDKVRIQDALKFSPALSQSLLAPWIPYYQLPYQFRPPGRVLILGGGSGNDATMALAYGAKRVTVVEIDEVILEQGSTTHPHRPYKDSRVHTINNDARSFLRTDQEDYDLILMNALDSHLQLPGLSTLRLESYMYTVEAFRDVKQLMNPDSIFIIHLMSTRRWMGERIYWSLTEAFGKEPIMLSTKGSPMGSIAFALGPEGAFERTRASKPVEVLKIKPDSMKQLKAGTVLATDDWPHLYLSHPTLPKTYLMVLGFILVITFLIFRFATPMGKITYHLHFFFLGAGFMLLETRSITKSAVLFGSTWIVNAVMIGSILSVVFLANLLVWKKRKAIPTTWCYGLLTASLLLGYVVPIDFILNYGWIWRILFVGAWLSFPIFFASILFSRSFQKVEQAHSAFGANLLGIAVGGILEYSSMVMGLQFLYLLAIGLYVLALVSARRTLIAR